jgi:geranylgeranyl diphosphate synthase type II
MRVLEKTYNELFPVFENYLNDTGFAEEPKLLYDSYQHIMSIKGKRIRPLLCLISCEAFGEDINKALPAAAAVEIFHNFTLVHDDIMDNADVRRGEPAVHTKFGINQAIICGDAMASHSYKQLCQIKDQSNFGEIVCLFTKTASEIMDGQQMDMDFETRTDVQEAEYLTMIKYKTSVLLAAALQMGAQVANASVEDQKHIYDFGLNLGLAFQIKDDWLDTYGEAAKVGKRIGGDILNNKKTHLLVTAMNSASEDQLAEFNRLFEEQDEEKKIKEVMDLYDELKINQQTYSKMEEFYAKSLECLEKVSITNKESLLSIAHSVYHRDF